MQSYSIRIPKNTTDQQSNGNIRQAVCKDTKGTVRSIARTMITEYVHLAPMLKT